MKTTCFNTSHACDLNTTMVDTIKETFKDNINIDTEECTKLSDRFKQIHEETMKENVIYDTNLKHEENQIVTKCKKQYLAYRKKMWNKVIASCLDDGIVKTAKVRKTRPTMCCRYMARTYKDQVKTLDSKEWKFTGINADAPDISNIPQDTVPTMVAKVQQNVKNAPDILSAATDATTSLHILKHELTSSTDQVVFNTS